MEQVLFKLSEELAWGTHKVGHKKANKALVKSVEDCDPEHVWNTHLQRNQNNLLIFQNKY